MELDMSLPERKKGCFRRTFASKFTMFRKVLLYGLPLYLYGLEFLLKTIASFTQDSIAGPTLAGAGIGFLLPLTELKTVHIDSKLEKALAGLGAVAHSPRDKSFSDFVWVAFFVALGAWMFSIYLTLRHVNVPQLVNWPLMIGALTFVVSIILTEIKERI
jgi:hypothetical protein